jgi:hypothetical protein
VPASSGKRRSIRRKPRPSDGATPPIAGALPPAPPAPTRGLSDTLRGALIGGLFALAGAVVGVAGSFYAERALNHDEMHDEARGVARVLQDVFTEREQDTTSFIEDMNNAKKEKDRRLGEALAAAYIADFDADLSRYLGPLPLSADDRKLLAIQLSQRDWTAVSRATMTMSSLQLTWKHLRAFGRHSQTVTSAMVDDVLMVELRDVSGELRSARRALAVLASGDA